ncbi:hypothetical protein B9Z55_003329 [Caenorhabditis nigoni]|nr:hypothetical protein B9Z55_003329 [Caenorhabditis nigoni]
MPILSLAARECEKERECRQRDSALTVCVSSKTSKRCTSAPRAPRSLAEWSIGTCDKSTNKWDIQYQKTLDKKNYTLNAEPDYDLMCFLNQ